MKQNVLLMGFCLLLAACGGSETTTNDSAASVNAAAPSESDEKEVLHQMPNSDQIEDAYDAILEQADVSDPELMEVQVSFSKSITGSERDDSHLSVKMVSPQDKNKILYYRYDFPEKRLREPVPVTLSTGIGSTEKFIDTYDGFKESLFKKSDVMDFDKADEVYEQAIAKSGYAPNDCYVNDLQFMHFPNGLRGSVGVQSSRSTTAHKSFSIDKAANLTAY